jgi:hypothetical protein
MRSFRTVNASTSSSRKRAFLITRRRPQGCQRPVRRWRAHRMPPQSTPVPTGQLLIDPLFRVPLAISFGGSEQRNLHTSGRAPGAADRETTLSDREMVSIPLRLMTSRSGRAAPAGCLVLHSNCEAQPTVRFDREQIAPSCIVQSRLGRMGLAFGVPFWTQMPRVMLSWGFAVVKTGLPHVPCNIQQRLRRVAPDQLREPAEDFAMAHPTICKRSRCPKPGRRAQLELDPRPTT